MRLLTIFLILYLLHVTAGVTSCDPSLIKESSDPTAEFEFNNGMLKCKDSKEIVIEGHYVRYHDLKCVGSRNLWVYGSSPLTPATKADKELIFKCKAKACDKSYIKGVNTSEIEYIDGKLKCMDDKYIAHIEDADKVGRYDELTCDVKEGWMDGEKKADDELNIQCKGKACDFSYISGVEPGKDAQYVNTTSTQWVLTCTNPQQFIEFPTQESVLLSRELTCDKKKNYWFYKTKDDRSGYVGKWADEQIDVKCIAKACHSSLIRYNDDKEVKDYDAEDKKLECKESFEFVSIKMERWDRNDRLEKSINAQSKVFTCDPFGKWEADGDKPTEILATDEIDVKCEVKACHKDLTNGTADKSEQDVLKCNADKVLQIKDDSNFYKTLKCSGSKWFDPTDQKEVQVKSATEMFTIDCIPEPCTYEANGIVYDGATRTLSCDPGEIELGGKSYKSLTCDGRVGWSEDGSVVAPAEPKLVANCKHFCTTPADVIYRFNRHDGSYDVYCKGFTVMLYDDGGTKKEVIDMSCSKDGWKSERINMRKSSVLQLEQLECENACAKQQKPKSPADIHSSDESKWVDGLTDLIKEVKSWSEFAFECKNTQLKHPKYVIKINGKLMDILTCKIDGYTDNHGNKIAGVLDSVKIACVEICATPADVDYTVSHDGSYVVTCKGIATMEYDEGRGKKEVRGMTCSMGTGWKMDGKEIGKPADFPLQKLTCKRACHNHMKPKIDGQDKWEDGLTDFAHEVSKESGKVQFECKNRKFGDSKSLIKLNGKLVNSHLICDFDGYTDIHGTKLADAFEKVKIECVDFQCEIPLPSRSLCDINFNVHGYECYNPLASYTEDPYQLKCDAGINLQRIYDVTAKKFLENKPVMCKEKDHYYFYGDANQEKIQNINNLLCVRLRCNSCKKLGNREAGAGVDNYTPGTADKCATDTCPNNYWKIKYGRTYHNQEEHAGEVICSSNRGSDGKWLINANSNSELDWVVEGYCIPSMTKKCTVDSPLDTECTYEWQRSGDCDDRLYTNDYDEIKCDSYYNMFYKKPHAEYFEEGAKSIECDKTKGIWTVKKDGGNDELTKGDHVICARSNPSPRPQTTSTRRPLLSPEDDTHTTADAEAQGGSSAIIGFSIFGVLLIVIVVIAIVANRMMKRKPKGKQAQISNNEVNKIPENADGNSNKDSKGVVNEANSVHSEPPLVTPA